MFFIQSLYRGLVFVRCSRASASVPQDSKRTHSSKRTLSSLYEVTIWRTFEKFCSPLQVPPGSNLP